MKESPIDIAKLQQYLTICKDKLKKYEAYTMQDGHINAFEKFTLKQLRTMIAKIEKKIAEKTGKTSVNFGEETAVLENNGAFIIDTENQYYGPHDTPSLQQQQILTGLQKESWSDATTIEEAFEYIDEGSVYHLTITDSKNQQQYTWLQWYSGDTEVGYIFDINTKNLRALISDGYIEHL